MHLTEVTTTPFISDDLGRGCILDIDVIEGDLLGSESPLIAACARHSSICIPSCDVCFQHMLPFGDLVQYLCSDLVVSPAIRPDWKRCEFCEYLLCPSCIVEKFNWDVHLLLCYQGDPCRKKRIIRLIRLAMNESECVLLAIKYVCRRYLDPNFPEIRVTEETTITNVEISSLLQELLPDVSLNHFHEIIQKFERTNLYIEIENPSMLKDISLGLLTLDIRKRLISVFEKIGYPAIIDDQDQLPPLPIVLGTGHYPTVALMNHSCVPNTEWRSVKGTNKIELVALTKISKGQEIRISYVDQSLPNRAQILRDRYGFECKCPLCL